MYFSEQHIEIFFSEFRKGCKCHEAGLNFPKYIHFLNKLEVQCRTTLLARIHGQLFEV